MSPRGLLLTTGWVTVYPMQLSVRLPDDLGERLRRAAEADSRTMGQVVRLAVEAFLAGAPSARIARQAAAVVRSEPLVDPVRVIEADVPVAARVPRPKPREVAEKLAAAVPGVDLGPPAGVGVSASPEALARVDKSKCPHPKVERRVKSWGTICGVCGKRL